MQKLFPVKVLLENKFPGIEVHKLEIRTIIYVFHWFFDCLPYMGRQDIVGRKFQICTGVGIIEFEGNGIVGTRNHELSRVSLIQLAQVAFLRSSGLRILRLLELPLYHRSSRDHLSGKMSRECCFPKHYSFFASCPIICPSESIFMRGGFERWEKIPRLESPRRMRILLRLELQKSRTQPSERFSAYLRLLILNLTLPNFKEHLY